jgi:hypothetical protein
LEPRTMSEGTLQVNLPELSMLAVFVLVEV